MSGPAPLLGHNLVRLLYLDEAGSDRRAPFLCVAGVLIHGDREWPEVDRQIRELIDKYIPEPDRPAFIFHATDLFHGSGYFDRRKPEWADEIKRVQIINELAGIIENLHLPVVFGHYEKTKFGQGSLSDTLPPDERARIIQSVAAVDCLIRSDTWLETFAPDELATVVHEDGTKAKSLIKKIVWIARSGDIIKAAHLDGFASMPGMPLKRIIDTVHFAEKAHARPLQLADLCAFVLGRGIKEKPVPEVATKIIFRHLAWILKAAKNEESAKEAVEVLKPLLS